MRTWCLALFTVFLSFLSPLSAGGGQLPQPKTLQSIRNFEGDKKGEFRNDFTAVLSDGSAWKIHPQDRGLFSRWALNDELEVGVRTSFYWFKREHKFYLYNSTREEEARVMLVDYQGMPLYVSVAQTDLVNEAYVPYTYSDSQGRVQTSYNIKRTYAKKLILNDSSVWTIKDEGKFDAFKTNTQVYLSRDPLHEEIGFFLVSGLEREAVFTKVSW
jgi:hypothetical protein